MSHAQDKRKTAQCPYCNTPIRPEASCCQKCRSRHAQGDMVPPNPSGLCMCGCGEKTPVAKQTVRSRGRIAGHPIQYIKGHYPIPHTNIHINTNTGCWDWQGNRNDDGYGITFMKGKVVLAHRWVWEQVNGPIPPSYELHHHCRNRRCVRPTIDHIEPLLPEDHRNLYPHPWTITAEQRAHILALAGTMTKAAIARKVGVSEGTVRNVMRGKGVHDQNHIRP